MITPQIAYGIAFFIFFFLVGKKAYMLIVDALKTHRRNIVQNFDQSNTLLHKTRTEYEGLLIEESNISKHLEDIHHNYQEEMLRLKEQHIAELKNNKDYYEKKKEQQEKLMDQEYQKKILNYQWLLLEERLKNSVDHHRDESIEILLKGSKKAIYQKLQAS